MALVSSALSVRVTTMLITTSDTRQFLCIFVHARYYNVNYLEWYAAIFHRFWHKLPGGMHSHSVWRIIIIDDKITNFFHPIGGKINAHWFQKRELDMPEPIAWSKSKAIRESQNSETSKVQQLFHKLEIWHTWACVMFCLILNQVSLGVSPKISATLPP